MKRELPKNVRQIGNVSDSSKIYVEDYVDTFFNQLCDKADQTTVGAFLVGEMVQKDEEDYIYVYGAIQMKEVVQKGKDIYINESTWKHACETCKQYFEDAEILGWFLTSVGQALETSHNLLKVHQKWFSRDKSLLVLKEARDKEEKYFIHKYRGLMECGGHYVYYEKNPEMQDYMISCRKKTGMTPSEIIEDTVTKNFRNVIKNKMDKKEEKGNARFVYGLSIFLVVLVLGIGVSMMNNYDKMTNVRDSLAELEDATIPATGNVVMVEDKDEEKDKEEPAEEKPEEKPAEQSSEEPKENATAPEENSVDSQQETTQSEQNVQGDGASNTYIVEKGDTLAVISRKIYGDTSHVEDICKMNGLEDGNYIVIGQKLLLP